MVLSEHEQTLILEIKKRIFGGAKQEICNDKRTIKESGTNACSYNSGHFFPKIEVLFGYLDEAFA